MTNTQFFEQAHKVSKRLDVIRDNILTTRELLERLLKTEEVEISEWAVRAGSIYITFEVGVEVQPQAETLTAIFRNCRTSGNLIEIESTELL